MGLRVEDAHRTACGVTLGSRAARMSAVRSIVCGSNDEKGSRERRANESVERCQGFRLVTSTAGSIERIGVRRDSESEADWIFRLNNIDLSSWCYHEQQATTSPRTCRAEISGRNQADPERNSIA